MNKPKRLMTYDLLKDRVIVHCTCPRCGITSTVELEPHEYDDFVRYEEGQMLIQNALPRLTNDERELLKTGLCNHCWNEIFSCDDEKDEVKK